MRSLRRWRSDCLAGSQQRFRGGAHVAGGFAELSQANGRNSDIESLALCLRSPPLRSAFSQSVDTRRARVRPSPQRWYAASCTYGCGPRGACRTNRVPGLQSAVRAANNARARLGSAAILRHGEKRSLLLDRHRDSMSVSVHSDRRTDRESDKGYAHTRSVLVSPYCGPISRLPTPPTPRNGLMLRSVGTLPKRSLGEQMGGSAKL